MTGSIYKNRRGAACNTIASLDFVLRDHGSHKVQPSKVTSEFVLGLVLITEHC